MSAPDRGRILTECAWIATADAWAIEQKVYDGVTLTDEERSEVDRLRVLGNRLSYAARVEGHTAQGLDDLYGKEIAQ